MVLPIQRNRRCGIFVNETSLNIAQATVLKEKLKFLHLPYAIQYCKRGDCETATSFWKNNTKCQSVLKIFKMEEEQGECLQQGREVEYQRTPQNTDMYMFFPDMDVLHGYKMVAVSPWGIMPVRYLSQ